LGRNFSLHRKICQKSPTKKLKFLSILVKFSRTIKVQ
jgi:hypothetical protein